MMTHVTSSSTNAYQSQTPCRLGVTCRFKRENKCKYLHATPTLDAGELTMLTSAIATAVSLSPFAQASRLSTTQCNGDESGENSSNNNNNNESQHTRVAACAESANDDDNKAAPTRIVRNSTVSDKSNNNNKNNKFRAANLVETVNESSTEKKAGEGQEDNECCEDEEDDTVDTSSISSSKTLIAIDSLENNSHLNYHEQQTTQQTPLHVT